MPSLVSRSCNNLSEVFKTIRDFSAKRGEFAATGIGWTIVDSSYVVDENTISAGDWVVLYSPSVSGWNDQYVRLRLPSLTRMYVEGWFYWNSTTHVGVTGVTSRYRDVSTAANLWISGDMDCVYAAVTHGASFCDIFTFGCSPYNDGAVQPIDTPALTAGSSVAITLASVPEWVTAGRVVMVHDNANYEFPTVQAVTGTTITLQTLSKS